MYVKRHNHNSVLSDLECTKIYLKMISTLSAYRDIILSRLKRIKVVMGIRINSADTRLKDSL